MSGYAVMRRWPLVFAAGWALFACFAVQPTLFGGLLFARILAATGAVLLAWLAWQPERQRLRVLATLVAIAFPLFRFLSLAWEPTPLPTASRVVAMTAWALLGLTLLILYPAVWYEGYKRQEAQNGSAS